MIQYSLCRIRQSLYIRLLLYDSLCQNPFSPVDIIFAQNVSIIAGILGSQVSVLIIKDLIYIYIKDFFLLSMNCEILSLKLLMLVLLNTLSLSERAAAT